MSLHRTNTDDLSETPKLYKFLIAVLVLSTMFLVAQTAMSSYFGSSSSTYPHLISEGSNGPDDIGPLDCKTRILGEHYFGDFQSEYCRMRQVTPYPIDRPSSYWPGFYVISGLLVLFPSSVSAFRVVVLLAFVFSTYVMRSHFVRKDLAKLAPLLVFTFFPFWFAIDRGNYGWIFGSLLVSLATTKSARSQRYWIIAVAISLKFPLAVFGLLFFADGNWKAKFKELSKFFGIFVFLNFLFPVLQWSGAQYWPKTVLRVQGLMPGESSIGVTSGDFDLYTRSDIHALFTSFQRLSFIGEFKLIAFKAILLGIIALVIFLSIRKLSEHENRNWGLVELSIVSGCLSVLLSPFSFSYGLMALLVPIVLLLSPQGDAVRFRNSYLMLLAVSSVPNAIPLRDMFELVFHPIEGSMNADFPDLGNFLIPVSLIAMLLLVAYSAVLSYVSTRETQHNPVVVSVDLPQ
jgi:hypothetical protein